MGLASCCMHYGYTVVNCNGRLDEVVGCCSPAVIRPHAREDQKRAYASFRLTA